jgi:hypothetical protein
MDKRQKCCESKRARVGRPDGRTRKSHRKFRMIRADRFYDFPVKWQGLFPPPR